MFQVWNHGVEILINFSLFFCSPSSRTGIKDGCKVKTGAAEKVSNSPGTGSSRGKGTLDHHGKVFAYAKKN